MSVSWHGVPGTVYLILGVPGTVYFILEPKNGQTMPNERPKSERAPSGFELI
jgi:hypothetical protein